jgi:predicted membrane protein
LLKLTGFFFAIFIFAEMKKKFVILNSFVMIAVLFAILLQYVHSYEHLAMQLSERKCHHKYNSTKEITHQHHNFDRCFVCDFTLSTFISSDNVPFEFKKTAIPSEYSLFNSKEITQFFKGSLFALRAPPSFIV